MGVVDRESSLYNEDLAPTPASARTWNLWHVASLWVGMAVCVPTYMLAGFMIDAGMSVFQAVLVIALGNVIVLVPMILNAHAGTKYGIPFPVFARASFGVRGANIPAVARALVACGWFGIQTWVGGKSIYAIGLALGVWDKYVPLPVLGINGPQLLCFFLFWVINVYFIWKGIESIKWLETLAAPFLIIAGVGLLLWARAKAGSWGPIMDKPGLSGPAFWKTFFPMLTAMVGFWATLALNIPDFSRFCRTQRDQIAGQTLGLPTTMTLFSFIGAAVTSATPFLFAVTNADGTTTPGPTLWHPDDVIARFDSLPVLALGLLGLAVATLSTNIAANVVSPANDFSNLAPRRISYRLGGYITAAIGLVIFPWKLDNNYVQGWLIGYSALLGPLGGILVADYWIIRRRVLVVEDLYRRGGIYEYANGFNLRAIAALVIGVIPNLPGFLAAVGVWKGAPALFVSLYSYAWFIGFGLAALVYTVLMLATSSAAAPPKEKVA